MKKLILFIGAIILCAAGNAQDFHKSKYFVKYPDTEVAVSGDCMVSVSPSPTEDSEARLVVANDNKTYTLDLSVKDAYEDDTKTVITFRGGVKIYTLRDSENGDMCKITIRGNDDDAFEKIVLLFSL